MDDNVIILDEECKEPTMKLLLPTPDFSKQCKEKEYRLEFVLIIPNDSVGCNARDINRFFERVGNGKVGEFIAMCNKIAREIFV